MAGSRRFLQQSLQADCKFDGRFLQRSAPVVGEAHNSMAADQRLAEFAIEQGEELLGLDGGIGCVAGGDRLQSAEGQGAGIEPEAIAGYLVPEVGGHAVGQHHDQWKGLLGGPIDPGGASQGPLVGTIGVEAALVDQAGDGIEAGDSGGVRFGEPAPQGAAGGGIGEVVEVADPGALLEELMGVAGSGNARPHRIGVYDEVVVHPFEEDEVGEQHPQALEQVPAFDIAGDHGELKPLSGRCPGQEAPQRRFRQHRLDAGNQAWIGAVPGDLQHHPLHAGIDRVARQVGHGAEQGEQGGKEGIEVAADQQGAASGRRHPHVALDPEAVLPPQQGAQLPQLFALLGVSRLALPLEALPTAGIVCREGGGTRAEPIDEVVIHLPQAEEIAHQPTPGVGDQMDPGPGREDPGQGQGVVDGAFGEGVVLEGVDAFPIGGPERAPILLTRLLQIPERTGTVGSGAVDEDEQRALQGLLGELRIRRAEDFRGVPGAAGPAVEPGADAQPLLDRPHQGLGAEPGHAELGHLAQLFLHLLPQPLLRPRERLGLGLLDQGIAAEIKAEQPGDQLAGAAAARSSSGQAPILQTQQGFFPDLLQGGCEVAG